MGLLACRNEDGAPVGVFNFSEIVRGAFCSAYLGYYALEPHAGQGYMSEGLALALELAFLKLRLHRVEALSQALCEAGQRVLCHLRGSGSAAGGARATGAHLACARQKGLKKDGKRIARL